MTTNGQPKFSYLLVGLGLGALSGLMATILGRRDNREALRERGGKSLDYINQQAGKLRETADEIMQRGQKLIARKGESDGHATEAEMPTHREDRRENPGR